MKKRCMARTTAISLLCILIVLAFAACAPKTNEQSQPEQTVTASSETPSADESAEKKNPLIGFANYSLANPYCATMAEGAKARAEELGIEINIVDNKVDAANQVTSIEDFITLGVDGILILPIDAAAIEDVVKEAREKGIPCIANSVPVENADIFVSADNYEMGYNAGKACAQWLNENKEGKGEVVYLNMPSLPTLIDRENGFKDALSELCPGAEIVMMVPGGTPEEALQSAETVLEAYPNIDAIVGCNDGSALGACSAVEAAGIDPAEIFIGGVDATPEAIAKIKEGGPYKATVDNIPYENGKLLIDLMDRLWKGEEIDYKYVLATKIVDASNISEY